MSNTVGFSGWKPSERKALKAYIKKNAEAIRAQGVKPDLSNFSKAAAQVIREGRAPLSVLKAAK